jgi:large subunit ribosomal protein L21
MYVVFEDGSRQYRVAEGDYVILDHREADKGARLTFDRVLLFQSGSDTQIGQPYLSGVRIVAEVVDHPTRKVTIQRFRRRKNYRRFKGHRLKYIKVQIRHILLPGQEPPAAPQAPVSTPVGTTADTPPAPVAGGTT